jgi:beta-lactamase class C
MTEEARAVELGGLRPLLEELRAAEGLSGLALVTARGDGGIGGLFVGTDPIGQPLGPETLFPVASITKLATALAVLRLVDAGELSVDDPLARHLPEAGSARPGVTLRGLLSHSSGVPYHIPEDTAAYGPGATWRVLADKCLATPPERPPGTYVQYSNLGYGLLALVVERRTGQEFPDALARLVLDPLGIEGYVGSVPPRPSATITDSQSEYSGTEYDLWNTAHWHTLVLPWAGLVTTASGALALVRAFLGVPPGFLSQATRAEATRNQNGELGGGFAGRPWPRCPWGLGPDIRGAKAPHPAPPEASPESFGHGGATGCHAWADPAVGGAWMFHGMRSFQTGWMERAGPRIGAAVLALH